MNYGLIHTTWNGEITSKPFKTFETRQEAVEALTEYFKRVEKNGICTGLMTKAVENVEGVWKEIPRRTCGTKMPKIKEDKE